MPNSARDVYGTGAKKKRKPRPRKPPPPKSEVAASSGVQLPKSVPPRHTPSFARPLGTPALEPQRKQAREAVRRAENAVGAPVVRLPRFPTLKQYTPAQRREIVLQTSKVIRQAVARGDLDSYLLDKPGEENLIDRLGHLADYPTRRAVHKYAGAVQTQQRQSDIALGERALGNRLLSKAPTLDYLAKVGKQVREQGLATAIGQAGEIKPGGTPTDAGHEIAGFLDDRIFNYAPGLRILQVPTQLGRAFVEDPVGTTKSSIRTGIESIVGIPQGIAAIIDDPGKALEEIGEDYKHRYGPLIEGNTEQFRQQVQDESGLTPFALDAAAVGAPVGRVASVAARPAAVGRAAEALAAAHEPILSRVLRASHEAATQTRPNLRFSGGEAGVKAQERSPNLFVALGQRKLDAKRAARFEKTTERAGLRQRDDGQLERTRATRDRIPGLQPGPGEVLPYYSLREAGPIRRLTGRVATDIGREKSKARLRLLTRRGKALADVEKAVRRLDEDELYALMPVVQLGLPAVTDAASRAAALRAIERRLATIKRNRKGERGVSHVLEDTNDNVALLRNIRDDPEHYLTPKLRQAADDLMAIQRREEELDPDLPAERATIRRDKPQAALLGLRREPDVQFLRDQLDELGLTHQARGRRVGPEDLQESHGRLAEMLPDERPAAATKLEKQAQARLNATQRVLNRAKEDLAEAEGRAAILSRNVTGTRAGEEAGAAGGGLGVTRAREAVEKAQGEVEVARDAYAAARDATRLVSSKHTMRLEPADAFDARVRKAAEEAGLEEPGYWMSQPRPRDNLSDAAVGSGGRAVAASKRYTGALHDIGAETHTPEVMVQGIERNIKRRFSWALVNRNMEVHAFEWSRGQRGEGLTAAQILRTLDDRHIDPNSVAFLNSRIVRNRETEEAGAARGRVVDPGIEEDLALGEVNRELIDSRKTLQDLKDDEIQGQALNRYLVVPKEVADELEHATRPDGAFARSVEIILKQKPSRILLGLFNLPWLTFQVASNAMLTGLGGAFNPLDVYGAHKWWRGLTPAQKDAVEVELGITHGKHFAMDQPRLGATADRFGPANHLISFWQAYKASKVGRSLHRANPLDAMFRADEAQNNFFRRVLFYNQAKKTAYKQMGESWRSMDGAQKKLMRVLGQPPEKLGGEIVKAGPEFERHAKAVNDFLGNYLSFSNRERQLLSRNVMFYGYLRYSLRFAFWTMPVHHPVTTAILGNIGRLGAQEIKQLFGVPRDYQLPTSMLAKLYTGASPEQVAEYVKSDGKRGRLPSSVNVGRMNPGLNALTQLEGAQQVVGLASPIYQMLADQAFEESTFTGRDFRILGQPTPAEAERPKDYYGSFWSLFVPNAPRNRIALADLLGLAFPYRLASKTGIPGVVDPMEGPQSDDSLLFSQRPMRYKDKAIKKSIEASIERERESGKQGLLANLLPFTPQEDLGPVVVAREREKEADAANRAMKKKPKRKKAKATYDYGGGSSSSYKSRYGG